MRYFFIFQNNLIYTSVIEALYYNLTSLGLNYCFEISMILYNKKSNCSLKFKICQNKNKLL